MKIELVSGASTYEAAQNVIKKIDTKNFDIQNIVVVPDAFSMQAENLVFDCLGIKSTFNIKVVGISKLANWILLGNNVNFTRVTALEEIFNIFNAVRECEQNFLYFRKCDIQFCAKILQIIKQFKACGIKPERIKNVENTLLDKKMHDLKIVYEKYEQLLGEKLDLSRLLEKSSFESKNFQELSKTNLFFINFDSFTLEIGEFICKLALHVNATFIGVAKPLSQNNSYIFEDDIIKKISALSTNHGVLIDKTNVATELTAERFSMAKNLFGFDVESGKSDFFINLLAKDIDSEVEFVAKYIKKAVYDGAKFKDFAIAVPDAKYYENIKRYFEKYQITFYSDDAVNLTQTILGRFVFKCIEIAKLGFSASRIESIVFEPLFDCEDREKILSDLFYYQISDEKMFVDYFPQFSKIVNQINLLKKCEKTCQYCDVLSGLIEIVKEKYQKIINQIEDENKYKEKSENEQAYNLVIGVFDKLRELGSEQKFEIFDFENLLRLSFESVKVETIPSYIDAVYVGDATESYFDDVDVLFVLGANGGVLPKTYNDTGIIDDEDIKNLKTRFDLEPEIKVLNRRNRLKLFECLLHAKKKLIVSCLIFEGGKQAQISSFVSDLRKMFGENILHASAVENCVLKGDELQGLLFYLGTKNNFQEAYASLIAKSKVPQKYAAVLQKIASEIKKDEDFEIIERKNNKKTISASELESYFSCPFRRFVDYDLRIKERDSVEADKRLFGQFEHLLLETFINRFATDAKNADADKFLQENFDVLAKKVYKKETLSSKHFVANLKRESKIILNNVIYERKYSDFSPLYTEYKIFDKFYKDKSLVGYVDRVDTYKDNFRIIDYKTGKQEDIKNGLFFGRKLQLFLYADAMQKKLKKLCAGVYYFDCQTKYLSKGQSQTKLVGLTRKDENVVYATDTRLGLEEDFKSDLIGMKVKKSAKKGEFPFSYGNIVDDFEKMFDYARDVSKNAIDEIDQGYVKPSPLEDACKFCPYVSICKHRQEHGQRQKGKFDENIF